ncbi:MAG TPA: hypothetical protein VMT00_08740 [Thermoanaerobaculia bacterium]|nr:hypothetical protein [Thermoanaerobaculia bacterium]
MAQLLLMTTLLTLAGLIVTSISGYLAASPADIARHILFALATVVVGLFSQSMTMFFFIGTGKEIKDKAKGAADEQSVVRSTRLFKSKVFPAAMWAMASIMVTFIIGGGVHTGKVPSLAHHLLSLLTIILFAWAYWVELRAMEENARLMERFLSE